MQTCRGCAVGVATKACTCWSSCATGVRAVVEVVCFENASKALFTKNCTSDFVAPLLLLLRYGFPLLSPTILRFRVLSLLAVLALDVEILSPFMDPTLEDVCWLRDGLRPRFLFLPLFV